MLDAIPALLLDICKTEFVPVLIKHSQLSYRSGIFTDCKIAGVRRISKTCPRTHAFNNRPVALLPANSKFIEKITGCEILNYLEHRKLIHDRQYGYRGQQSTANYGFIFSLMVSIW